jgi:hypothetical protein
MIPTRRILTAAWTTAGLATMTSAVAWTLAVPTIPAPGPEPIALAPAMLTIDEPRPGQASDDLRRHDPFRLDRTPTNARYNPYAPIAPQPAARPAAVRPPLALAGIVGGPPWNALIEGIPGRENGVLLAVGDSTNGVRLVRIAGDTATVAGFDTVWVLTPRQPWR